MKNKKQIQSRINKLNELISAAMGKATFDDRYDDVIRAFENERDELQKELEAIQFEDQDR